MPKVKIVQIALAGGDDIYSEYLDDKGRVWHIDGHWDKPDDRENRKWVQEWKQFELPEEPESLKQKEPK